MAKEAAKKNKEHQESLAKLEKESQEAKKKYEDQIKKQMAEFQQFELNMAQKKKEATKQVELAMNTLQETHQNAIKVREEEERKEKLRVEGENALKEAEHQKIQAMKKAQHEDMMKNVWAASSTGVSVATITLPNSNAADELVTALFKKTLIADVSDFSKVKKVFRQNIIGNALQHLEWQEVHRLVMLTNDDRVPELIEECVDVTKNEKADILIRQLSGVGKEYHKWVAQQTEEETEQFRKENSGITETWPVKSKEFAPQSRKEIEGKK